MTYHMLIYLLISHHPSTTSDCNEDSDCAGKLECYQRPEDDSPNPPGCGGSAKGDTNYCYDPYCENQLANLMTLQEGLSNQNITSSTFFDESIALLFGNKTTIGQVCSYSRGLESQTVEDTPGFCCLDAPYEAQDWGETVSKLW